MVILLSTSRTPRWVRGLKYIGIVFRSCLCKSHPTMGAWIEIQQLTLSDITIGSRTPRWVRGLKYTEKPHTTPNTHSHPTMGAWIEILQKQTKNLTAQSHPTMGAWIEIVFLYLFLCYHTTSHPTMGAWIEISSPFSIVGKIPVALHDGCVD